MKKHAVLAISIAMMSVMYSAAPVFADDVITRTFDAKPEVKIELILGSCVIENSDDNKIHVKIEYTYSDDEFEAVFKERERYVEIEEKLHKGNARGSSSWMVLVPEKTEVDFNSATGNLRIKAALSEADANSGTGRIEIRNSRGEFELNSGTGRVEVYDSEGEFDLNSGTGSVLIEKCKGEFEANSGTGKVEANEITIVDQADLNSGTGDVEVRKPMGENFELYLNSGTNDAFLDMDGEPLKGYFELSAQRYGGKIEAPPGFSEKQDEGSNGTIRKTYSSGDEMPRYYISTGTGTAELKK